MSGKLWRFDIRHFLCIFSAEYSTNLKEQENQLHIFVKAQGCNTPQNAANLFLRVKIYREPGKSMQNIAKHAQAGPGRRVKKDH